MESLKKTIEAYKPLQEAYDFFNKELFDGKLPGAIITLSKHNPKVCGYYKHKSFVDTEGNYSDEIAMNPRFFLKYPLEEVLSTLVHEQVHQYLRVVENRKTRKGYHDKFFSEKMESIGLMASDTGFPGGKRTGQHMSDYIIAEGKFLESVKVLIENGNIKINWYDSWPIEREKIPKIFPANFTKQDFERLIENVRRGNQANEFQLTHQGAQGDDNVVSITSDGPGGVVHTIMNLSREDAIDYLEIEDDDDGLVVISGIDEFSPISNPVNINITERENDVTESVQTRMKFTCPSCNNNLWGKKSLKVLCMDCNVEFALNG